MVLSPFRIFHIIISQISRKIKDLTWFFQTDKNHKTVWNDIATPHGAAKGHPVGRIRGTPAIPCILIQKMANIINHD